MLSDLRYRLRALFRRSQIERELDEELRFHLDRQAEKHVASGSSPEEALRRARLELGGVEQVKERCREIRGLDALDRTWRDLRYAFRSLTRTPGFTFIALATLSLGIGLDSAVFSAIHAILLRPLPFPESDRITLLDQYRPSRGSAPQPVAPLRLQDWNRLSSAFETMSGYYTEDVSETSGVLPEKVTRAWVAPRFFQVLGVAPEFGRTFTGDEERYGGPAAVIVSHALWRRRFGSDPAALGKRLRLGAFTYSIVGIMPASFAFPSREVEVWSPVPFDSPVSQSRDSTWFTVVGRLRANVTLASARADLAMVQAHLGNQFPKTDADLAVRIRFLKEVTVGGVRRSLWILFASVSLLLLIACTNIAALSLARAAGRQREISIRLSMGASRAVIVAQWVTEAFALALLGSVLGLAVAAGASGLLHRLAPGFPRGEEVGLDGTLVLYTLGCAAGTTILCGLLPAMRATRATGRRIAGSLADTARTQVSAPGRLPWFLVGLQVSLAVTLLVGAGLLLRSLRELGQVSPGFDPGQVLTFRVSANWGETADMARLRRRLDGILDALRALPGVEGAATSVAPPGVPLQFPSELRIVEASGDPNRKVMASTRFVSRGYFATMRIPLLEGESCSDAVTPSEAVVNQSFVRTYLRQTRAVGLHLETVPSSPHWGDTEIRGIVADAREEGLDNPPAPTVYRCTSAPVPSPWFLLRTRTGPMAMAETIRIKLHEIEPERSVYDVEPLEERLGERLADNRLRTVLLTFFAVSAVSLACMGLYGTLSYFINLRRREVGLRMALGGSPARIVAQFLLQGVRVCFFGAVVGLCLAVGSTRALSGMLYGISSLDPMTFAGVLVLVVFTGAAASLVPASRAARLQPTRVLREE